jgi:hypothetical protein
VPGLLAALRDSDDINQMLNTYEVLTSIACVLMHSIGMRSNEFNKMYESDGIVIDHRWCYEIEECVRVSIEVDGESSMKRWLKDVVADEGVDLAKLIRSDTSVNIAIFTDKQEKTSEVTVEAKKLQRKEDYIIRRDARWGALSHLSVLVMLAMLNHRLSPRTHKTRIAKSVGNILKVIRDSLKGVKGIDDKFRNGLSIDRVIRTPFAVETLTCHINEEYVEEAANCMNHSLKEHNNAHYARAPLPVMKVTESLSLCAEVFRPARQSVSNHNMFVTNWLPNKATRIPFHHQTEDRVTGGGWRRALVEIWRVLPAPHEPRGDDFYSDSEKALRIFVTSLREGGDGSIHSIAREVLDGLGATGVRLHTQEPLTSLYLHEAMNPPPPRWPDLEANEVTPPHKQNRATRELAIANKSVDSSQTGDSEAKAPASEKGNRDEEQVQMVTHEQMQEPQHEQTNRGDSDMLASSNRKSKRMRKQVDKLDPSHVPRPIKPRNSRTAPLEAPSLASAPAIDADTSPDPQTDDGEAQEPASEGADSDTDSIEKLLVDPDTGLIEKLIVDPDQLPKQHTNRKGNAKRIPDRTDRDRPQPTRKSQRTRPTVTL